MKKGIKITIIAGIGLILIAVVAVLIFIMVSKSSSSSSSLTSSSVTSSNPVTQSGVYLPLFVSGLGTGPKKPATKKGAMVAGPVRLPRLAVNLKALPSDKPVCPNATGMGSTPPLAIKSSNNTFSFTVYGTNKTYNVNVGALTYTSYTTFAQVLQTALNGSGTTGWTVSWNADCPLCFVIRNSGFKWARTNNSTNVYSQLKLNPTNVGIYVYLEVSGVFQ